MIGHALGWLLTLGMWAAVMHVGKEFVRAHRIEPNTSGSRWQRDPSPRRRGDAA